MLNDLLYDQGDKGEGNIMNSFFNDESVFMPGRRNGHGDIKKSRVIVRKGNSYIPLQIQKIAIVYSSSGLNFLIDYLGNKYIIENTLGELESQLPNNQFFRVNRKVILNIDTIKEYKAIEFGKIVILLNSPKWFNETIVVSQVTAPLFKAWIKSL